MLITGRLTARACPRSLVTVRVGLTARLRLLLGVFLCVLWLNQTLGLLHGIAHMHAGEVHGGSVQEHAHENTDQDHGFLAHLFGGHVSENDCRLYYHSSHMDAMPAMALLALALVLLPFFFVVPEGLAQARWHALFQARGPPLIR